MTATRAVNGLSRLAIQRASATKGNSVLLHELYFDAMVPKTVAPNAELRSGIEKGMPAFK